ncbi:hypothetical protein QM092_07010 [Enterobacter hormaechei]|uniref:hypothetical protein n=1 Tax=Enterobacter cloacae complex TaxID=354276 RepID=UPI000642BC7B|nr:hypothetical protein [Enterobacter hormaechei]KLR15363.1 hypothetical protein ABR27_10765 [Enterobacter hormaechei subsp. hormaechei]MBW7690436.1 hypothetical protein [Enterobacter hormaechei]MDV5369776.1 hypothetical protein [Enterobacter hormaechei]RTP15623.1 hypothetical protein EKN51_11400 [Enterobacter hormaechei]
MTFQDESIFGFLFRTQLIYGYLDFSNIFRMNGMVRTTIIAKEELLPVYRRVNKKILYLMINRSQREKISLEQPYSHLDELNRFLQQGVAVLNGSAFFFVRFCKECLDECYKLYGIGYFKKEWEKNLYCNRHKRSLSEMTGREAKHSVDIMTRLILGNPLYDGDFFTNLPLKAELKKITGRVTRPFSLLYIKPCAILSISKWVVEKRHALSLILPGVEGNIDRALLLKKMSDNPEEFIIKLYNERNNPNLKEFGVFLSQTTKNVIEKYGVFSDDEFRFKVMKSKNINCLNCSSDKLSENCRMRLRYNI